MHVSASWAAALCCFADEASRATFVFDVASASSSFISSFGGGDNGAGSGAGAAGGGVGSR